MSEGSLRRLAAACLAIVAVTLLAGSSVAHAGQLVTITIPDRGQIHSKWLSYSGPPRANVLLPDDFDKRKRYPLLILLNGLNTNYAWWTQTGLTKEFERLDAIVVMPEGGSGWYADWWNGGERGDPAWESYHLETVIPAILARYRIRPQRRYHALAGTSMGGLGATYLGGRLPGFFGSVASISGFVDPHYGAPVTQAAMGLLAFGPFKGSLGLNPVHGPAHRFYAEGHNPTRLAMNLRRTRVFVATGTGEPSEDQGFNVPGSPEEQLVIYPMSERYHRALTAAGVDVTYQVMRGGHDIPTFANETRAMLEWGLFRRVVSRPRSWVNETVATRGRLWNIRYRFDEPPSQVVRFRRSGGSLSVSPAGSAVALTMGRGCAIHVATPAQVRVPAQDCAPNRR